MRLTNERSEYIHETPPNKDLRPISPKKRFCLEGKKAQAGDMIMIFPFLLMLIIIFTSIWIGTSGFFGSEYDSRAIDAEILHHKIRTCLQENTFDWTKNITELEKEFYPLCGINENVVKTHLGLEIKLNDEIKIKWKGDPTQCQLSDKNKNFPICKNSTLILGENTFNIVAGSSQTGRVGVK